MASGAARDTYEVDVASVAVGDLLMIDDRPCCVVFVREEAFVRLVYGRDAINGTAHCARLPLHAQARAPHITCAEYRVVRIDAERHHAVAHLFNDPSKVRTLPLPRNESRGTVMDRAEHGVGAEPQSIFVQSVGGIERVCSAHGRRERRGTITTDSC